MTPPPPVLFPLSYYPPSNITWYPFPGERGIFFHNSTHPSEVPVLPKMLREKKTCRRKKKHRYIKCYLAHSCCWVMRKILGVKVHGLQKCTYSTGTHVTYWTVDIFNTYRTIWVLLEIQVPLLTLSNTDILDICVRYINMYISFFYRYLLIYLPTLYTHGQVISTYQIRYRRQRQAR